MHAATYLGSRQYPLVVSVGGLPVQSSKVGVEDLGRKLYIPQIHSDAQLCITFPHVVHSPGSRLGLSSTPAGSMTSGLVGEMQHQLLPSIPPWFTMATTLLAMLVSGIDFCNKSICMDWLLLDSTV